MKRARISQSLSIVALVCSVAVAACSKDSQPAPGGDDKKATTEGPAVKLTGRVVTIEAYSDGVGNYFKPNEVEAHRGDVVRFVLKSGVHNVHFVADSNPANAVLPAASDMLQLPDQTYDFTVNVASGKYYFQCDPHAMLGMVGHIKVVD